MLELFPGWLRPIVRLFNNRRNQLIRFSTSLTVEYFDAGDRGSIYGVPCIPDRLDQRWIRSKTPFKRLYLTGADSVLFGIMGAMMGGVKTAGLVTGPLGFFRIMSAVMKESATQKSVITEAEATQ